MDNVGTAVVIRLGGEIDLYNSDEVRAALARAVDGEPSCVVVDFSQVEFVDSTVLGVLVEARSRLGERGLRIAGPQLETMRALKVSGLDRHLAVYESLEAALAE